MSEEGVSGAEQRQAVSYGKLKEALRRMLEENGIRFRKYDEAEIGEPVGISIMTKGKSDPPRYDFDDEE
jgi:G:T-mismatch repair DNA endonuclease (very short patch repair protein)